MLIEMTPGSWTGVMLASSHQGERGKSVECRSTTADRPRGDFSSPAAGTETAAAIRRRRGGIQQ